MRQSIKVTALVMALGAAASARAQEGSAQSCDRLSAPEHVVALNEIQNLMGRYAHLGTLRGESTLAELFAMNTAGTSWKTPYGPDGLDPMKQRFERPAEEDPGKIAGQLIMHAMLTPVIEIAGDGKTAQGVWDSFGPSIANGETVGNWLWLKYGVDFIKENGHWKIWHLQVYPVFSTPYDKSITRNAKERAAASRTNARPRESARQPGWSGPKELWIYDGKTPPRGPKIPQPYCTFDPQDAY